MQLTAICDDNEGQHGRILIVFVLPSLMLFYDFNLFSCSMKNYFKTTAEI